MTLSRAFNATLTALLAALLAAFAAVPAQAFADAGSAPYGVGASDAFTVQDEQAPATEIAADASEIAAGTTDAAGATDAAKGTDNPNGTATFTRPGIDVSQWNGNINWSKAADSIEFAIVRCGYGENLSKQDDTRWLKNAKDCIAAGVPMGVYLYSYAKTASAAKSEANHVVRCLKEASLDATSVKLPIYLDMEDVATEGLSKAKQKEVFDQFRATLNANGYGDVGIYSSASWWDTKLSTIDLDADYRWIAHWGVSAPGVGFSGVSASSYGIWQYSSNGSVAGMSGAVDMNYARSDWTFLGQETTESTTMYRLYNPYTGEHLYTANVKESSKLSKVGWENEGIAWKTPSTSDAPVYRLYNKHAKGGDHHYTTSKEEYDDLKDVGWKGEGVAWYSAASDQTPIYRVYNPNAYSSGGSGAHHYTKSKKERNKLVKLGWKDEKIAWYGSK